ncbi:hypothetical protein E4U53_001734 [Claviceps sorghi]|nr:hypothetical protein E4U53_001734 [Claviceps sorghi]
MATTTTHRRGPWSRVEDEALEDLVARHGPSNWVEIAKVVGSRSAKQCRERYHQSLNPNLNHSPITDEEGLEIQRLVRIFGTRWAEIARRMNGRSDNCVKNWWNGLYNRLKRRIRAGDFGSESDWYEDPYLMNFAASLPPELALPIPLAAMPAGMSAGMSARTSARTSARISARTSARASARASAHSTRYSTAHPTGYPTAHPTPSTSINSTPTLPPLTPSSRASSWDSGQYRGTPLEAPLMSPSVSDPGLFRFGSNYTTSPAPPRSQSLDMDRAELAQVYDWHRDGSDDRNTWLPGIRFLQYPGFSQFDYQRRLPPIRNSSQLPTAPNTPMPQQDSQTPMSTPEEEEPPQKRCRKLDLADLLS